MPSSVSAPRGSAAPRDPLELVLRDPAKLPSFPDVLFKIDEVLRHDEADLARVEELVAMDPVVSGQILRMANSAWYNRSGTPVQDLTRAIIRLGLPATRDIVHALVLPAVFRRREAGAVDLAAYWRHSFGVALFAQAIGRLLGANRSELEVLWSAGLLHDIGALLFDLSASDTYREVFRTPGSGSASGVPLVEIERDWLGGDHAGVGAGFLEKVWKLPEPIVRAVRLHEERHLPRDPQTVRTVAPIRLAEQLCAERGIDWVPAGLRHGQPASALCHALGIEDSDIARLEVEVVTTLERTEAMLGPAG